MEGRFKKPSYFPQVKVWVRRGRAGALVWSSGGGLKRKSQSSENGDRRSRPSDRVGPQHPVSGRQPWPGSPPVGGVSPGRSGSEVRRRRARAGRAGGALPRDCLEEALAVSLSRLPLPGRERGLAGREQLFPGGEKPGASVAAHFVLRGGRRWPGSK